jgi:hypothetical protein
MARRIVRLEHLAAQPFDGKPWVKVLVDGETEGAAYQRHFGLPFPEDAESLPHNVIFRVIVDH